MSKRIAYEPVIETKRRLNWPVIILCILIGLALAVWWYLSVTTAEAEVYVEDHSRTEAMIDRLKPIAPELRARIAAIVDQECSAQGVPVELVLSLIARESGFKADAISKKGDGLCSYGLMQVNPGNAAHPKLLWKYSLTELMLPENNIKEGVAILKMYLDRSQSTAEALGRYCGSQGMAEYKTTIMSNTIKLMSKEV